MNPAGMILSGANKIYLAGHRGMVGSALLQLLQDKGPDSLLLRTSAELDLRDYSAVDTFFKKEKPDCVIVAAAKVGGIMANQTYPAQFLADNLAIAHNTIDAAYRHKTKRLLYLGSSCIYPREAPQPMSETALLTGPLEPINEAYAIAKIAGLKLCQFYRRQYGALFHSAMPTNLYGPGDNYDLQNSHVIPAIIRRLHEAKEQNQPDVTLWGTGSPRREFLHVDDLANALLHLLELDDPPDWINIGTGKDLTILELSQIIKRVVGYEGRIDFDSTKPDGSPRKLLDVSRLQATGWSPKISLEDGIARTCQSFLQEKANGTLRQ